MISEFTAALCDRDAILILSHLRPDGDTLGSGGGALQRAAPHGQDGVPVLQSGDDGALSAVCGASFFAPADFVPACVVAVDIATPNLFPQGAFLARSIWHRPPPQERGMPGYAPARGESACGEAVLELIELMTGSVTEQEANLLYIAVTTDTGLLPVREHERGNPARRAAAGTRRR